MELYLKKEKTFAAVMMFITLIYSCHTIMFMLSYPLGIVLHFVKKKKNTEKMKNLHLLHVHILSITCGAVSESS